MMKRTAVLKKVVKAGKAACLDYTAAEGTHHTVVKVGATSRALGRHSEVDDLTAKKFFDQLAD